MLGCQSWHGCSPIVALVPLASRAAVFHYPRLSQFSLNPGLEWSGMAMGCRCQAVHQAGAKPALDCFAVS